MIHPRHWQRGARPPETVEILISDQAADGEFVSAGTFALADAPGWQRLAIAAQAATRVKLRILSVHGSGRPAIGEVVIEGNEEVDKSDIEEKIAFAATMKARPSTVTV